MNGNDMRQVLKKLKLYSYPTLSKKIVEAYCEEGKVRKTLLHKLYKVIIYNEVSCEKIDDYYQYFQSNPLSANPILRNEKLYKSRDKLLQKVIDTYYRKIYWETGNLLVVLKQLFLFFSYLYEETTMYTEIPHYINKLKKVMILTFVTTVESILEKQTPEWIRQKTKSIDGIIEGSGIPVRIENGIFYVCSLDRMPDYIGYEYDKQILEKSEKSAVDDAKSIMSAIDIVEVAITYVSDGEISKQMQRSISLLQCARKIIEKEGNKGNTRKLLNYYLPTYCKLLSTYCDTKSQFNLVGTENTNTIIKEIEEAVPMVNNILQSYINSSVQKQMYDVQTDIDVLATVAKQDGLTEQQGEPN